MNVIDVDYVLAHLDMGPPCEASDFKLSETCTHSSNPTRTPKQGSLVSETPVEGRRALQ